MEVRAATHFAPEPADTASVLVGFWEGARHERKTHDE